MLKVTVNFLIILNCFVHTSVSSLIISTKLNACLIRNKQYKDEYLYSTINEYYIFEGRYHFKRKETIKKVFTNEMDKKYIETLSQMIWVFEPVNQDINNQTYFIRNLAFSNYYLCPIPNHLEIYKHRRLIGFRKESIELKKSNECIWRVDSSAHKNNYLISSVFYNEPLYAASNIYISMRRNVFSWYKQKPDSKQFFWHLEC